MELARVKLDDKLDPEADNETDTPSSNMDESDESDVSSSDTERTTMSANGIFSRREAAAYYGFVAQYVAVGIITGGIPGLLYGVFMGYLNVPGYVYATVGTVVALPWSFKFFFGLINDTVPIYGLRRKPYMILGWSLCALTLLVVANTPLPPPYWCVDAEGAYIKKRPLGNGHFEQAEPCHKESAEQSGKFAVLLMVATLGYVVADVAADGLLTEYAKAEPMEKRGRTQTTAYMAKAISRAFSILFVGLCMNSKRYNGNFSWGLSFEAACFYLSLPAAAMVPVTAWLVREPHGPTKQVMSTRAYMSTCWELLRSKACFFIILYMFFQNIKHVHTTAGSLVKKEWAGVQQLQNQMFSLVGTLLFAAGLWIVRRKFLNSSWRMMLVITTVFLEIVDFCFTTTTTFGGIRNQYFYLGEAVLTEVPHAVNSVVSLFVVVEMADDGNEGMVYGLLTTAHNLGYPFATAVANQVYQLFQPSLSDTKNYIEDSPAFRWTVFYSFLMSYAFAFLSMGLLWLLPDQKEDAQQRKRDWTRRTAYGVATITILVLALAYSLSVSFLSMSPKTMCLKFAGGSGCNHGGMTLAGPAH